MKKNQSKVMVVRSKVMDMAGSVKDTVVDSAQHVGEQLEAVGTLGLAGMAEDRGSKVLAVVGGTAVLTGAVLKAPVVVFLGVGVFTAGFVRGFKKAIQSVKEEEI